MAAYILTTDAQHDLDQAIEASRDSFGQKHAALYLARFRTAFEALGEAPSPGLPCEGLQAGLWRCAVGSHVVYYQCKALPVRIVRVLHKRMLPGLHL